LVGWQVVRHRRLRKRGAFHFVTALTLRRIQLLDIYLVSCPEQRITQNLKLDNQGNIMSNSRNAVS
jgi:hypothetical protein